jgi:hypothetical protein
MTCGHVGTTFPDVSCQNEQPCDGMPHKATLPGKVNTMTLTWWDDSPEARAEFDRRVGNVIVDGIPLREYETRKE